MVRIANAPKSQARGGTGGLDGFSLPSAAAAEDTLLATNEWSPIDARAESSEAGAKAQSGEDVKATSASEEAAASALVTAAALAVSPRNSSTLWSEVVESSIWSEAISKQPSPSGQQPIPSADPLPSEHQPGPPLQATSEHAATKQAWPSQPREEAAGTPHAVVIAAPPASSTPDECAGMDIEEPPPCFTATDADEEQTGSAAVRSSSPSSTNATTEESATHLPAAVEAETTEHAAASQATSVVPSLLPTSHQSSNVRVASSVTVGSSMLSASASPWVPRQGKEAGSPVLVPTATATLPAEVQEKKQ